MGKSIQQKQALKTTSFLGWAGLIPFALAALGAHSKIEGLVLYSFLGGTTYAAVILSFLGAIHWGLAMQDDRNSYWYVWSVIPALLGFCSLLILDDEIRIASMIPIFFLVWAVDRRAYKQGLMPNWYITLRTILTFGAIISLASMLFA